MKLLFLLTQDLESPSGLGRFFPLARELTELGHKVSIVSLHSNFSSLSEKRFNKDGVDIWYVAPMHVRKYENTKSYYPVYKLLALTSRATWNLSHATLLFDADIVHIGKPHPMNSIAGLLARYLRKQQVYLDCDDYEVAVGNFSSHWQRKVIEVFENNIPNYVSYITTNTFFTRKRLTNLGIPKERIIYLPNGVDRQRFRKPDPLRLINLREELGIIERSQVITFVGSLSRPGHPVESLLMAFNLVRNNHPEAVLLIVGGGDDFEHLKQQSLEMGISRSVIFTGRVAPEDVASYYYLADVSVDPVNDDDAARGRSPLKLFESWACNVAFVSADVGDRRTLIGNPPAGLLAQPGDVESLANEIQRILREPDLKRELVKNGRERVKDFYWDKLAKELEQIYIRHFPKNK
jgi:glycosyltransferase involved in cell wall biosynthesis